jgi:hypothetical protein
MAQLMGILFSLLLVSSRRMVVSVVERMLELTFVRQWEYFTPGGKEPFKVERDTNGDGKADAVWDKGTSSSKGRR